MRRGLGLHTFDSFRSSHACDLFSPFGWACQIAAYEKAGFIDLNEIVARRYDSLGAAAVEPLFADPHTHTSRAGAELNAESVIAGLKALPANPLAQFFDRKAAAIDPAN
jgi:hypothetical protein